jgi:hypothetical protein
MQDGLTDLLLIAFVFCDLSFELAEKLPILGAIG